VIVLSAAACAFASDLTPLSKARYLDKCNGAWAGQMISVCFGGQTEFKYCGKTITGDLPAWAPSRTTCGTPVSLDGTTFTGASCLRCRGTRIFNRHADDIDFRIESDVLGVFCPGMPDGKEGEG
jgi:hypothetical protein